MALGAQNCAIEDSGAFTGEVSPLMLARLHVQYVIVGHSERRQLFGETDEVVAAKLQAVLRNGMTPICCVGETLEERELGADQGPAGRPGGGGGRPPCRRRRSAGLVIAYEPIWAIGTGQAATPEDAQEACLWIREMVGRCSSAESAAQVRIQYGGSVNADNTESLVRCPDVDGALVGGASLDAAEFAAIIRAAAQSVR